MKKDKPLYKKHKKSTINATIKLHDNTHRAFLIALCDIKKDDEIFCHYGFMYWFFCEASDIGFLPEEELDKNGAIREIFKYPAFVKYIYEFFGDVDRIEYVPYSQTTTDVIIHHKTGGCVVMPLKNEIIFDAVKLEQFSKQLI